MATYQVTGDGGGPDGSPNGIYHEGGVFGGEPYYQQGGGAGFYLFLDAELAIWTIGLVLVEEPTNCWYRSPPIEGTYQAYGLYTGNPVVALATAARTLMGAGI